MKPKTHGRSRRSPATGRGVTRGRAAGRDEVNDENGPYGRLRIVPAPGGAAVFRDGRENGRR